MAATSIEPTVEDMFTILGRDDFRSGCEQGPGQEHRADGVDPELVEDVLGAQLQDVALVVGHAEGPSVDAGVVDQHVDGRRRRRPRRTASIDASDPTSRVEHVVGQLAQLVGGGRAATAGPHLVAAARVMPGELQAESAVGAGDDDPLGHDGMPSSSRARSKAGLAIGGVDLDRVHTHGPRPVDALRGVVEEHDGFGRDAERLGGA